MVVAADALNISVVIPCFRDEAALAILLPMLRQCLPQPGEIIVVFADAVPSPAVATLCAEHQVLAMTALRGRGVQLRTGAAAASGDVLWFLHADAAPPRGAIEHIRTVVGDGAVGGYFRFRFAGARTMLKRVLERGIALRCKVSMVYGDQAIFATRAAYAATPGFAAAPLFEEVPLVRGLRRVGRFVAVSDFIEVSPRRWERDGYLQRTVVNRMLALGYSLGISPERLASWYR